MTIKITEHVLGPYTPAQLLIISGLLKGVRLGPDKGTVDATVTALALIGESEQWVRSTIDTLILHDLLRLNTAGKMSLTPPGEEFAIAMEQAMGQMRDDLDNDELRCGSTIQAKTGNTQMDILVAPADGEKAMEEICRIGRRIERAMREDDESARGTRSAVMQTQEDWEGFLK